MSAISTIQVQAWTENRARELAKGDTDLAESHAFQLGILLSAVHFMLSDRKFRHQYMKEMRAAPIKLQVRQIHCGETEL